VIALTRSGRKLIAARHRTGSHRTIRVLVSEATTVGSYTEAHTVKVKLKLGSRA
jgi:hypothetical protein